MTCYEIRAKAREVLGGKIFGNRWMFALLADLIVGAIAAVAGSVIPGLGALIITGPLTAGLSIFYLSLIRSQEDPKIELLFDGFKNFGDNFLLGLMVAIFTFLWSLLFIIPGIVKSYSYSMAFFVKKDHPEMDWKACMDESQRLMDGNKGRLFLLDLSYIGWLIVGSLCCGIGVLWVSPYMNAAHVVFYEEIKQNVV